MFSYELIEDKNKRKTQVMFNGDLDIEITEVMEEQIIPTLMGHQTININLSNVAFVDSTGIGLLINLIDTLKKESEQTCITISNVQPQVKDIFELIQLADIIGENTFVE